MSGSRWVTTASWLSESLTSCLTSEFSHSVESDSLQPHGLQHARLPSWWWTRKPGVLQSMGSQKVGHNWVTELNWTSFWYSSSACSCHLFLITSASVRSLPFLFFVVLIFAWNVPLITLIFLKRSLVLPFYCFPLFVCSVHFLSIYILKFYFFFHMLAKM